LTNEAIFWPPKATEVLYYLKDTASEKQSKRSHSLAPELTDVAFYQ
jgi:hypothetical protein